MSDLTINDLPVGTEVMINVDIFDTYGVPQGSIGTIDVTEYSDVRVRFDSCPTPQSLWLYPSQVSLVDLSTVTDADLFRRLAVKVLFEHKAKNGWCGTAEALAVQMGLSDYLPVNTDVTIPHTVTVLRWPGDTDSTVAQRANRMIRDAETGRNSRSGEAQIEARENPYTPERGYDVDETPEGETLDEFRVRLAQTAIKGARQHGVPGVNEFLTALGIDPSTIKERRTLYATVEVEVEVDASTNVREYARDLFTLALPSDVTVSDAWGA